MATSRKPAGSTPSGRRKQGRSQRRPPADAPPTKRLIGPVVDWSHVPSLVRSLFESVDKPSDLLALKRLVMGLTEPFRVIDSLTELANRGMAGDEHAASELRTLLAAINGRNAAIRDFDAWLSGLPADGKDCACGTTAVPTLSSHSSGAGAVVQSALDERAGASLLLAVARLHADHPEAMHDALASMMTVAAGAAMMAGLIRTFRHGGPAALSAHVGQLGALGQLDWAGGIPELPMTDLGGPFPRNGIEELIRWLKDRKPFDPEIWDHPHKFWRDPLYYWDKSSYPFIVCMAEVRRRLNSRAAIAPPVQPVRSTWANGITSITAPSPCVGSRIVIHGTGLATPNTVLLLPFADGCRVVDVPAGDWTDTAITVTLPAGVVSGPLGFGDAAYIAAYDAWALQQNALASDIEKLPCHVGEIAWVPPFRACPPDIGVNRIRAGSASIEAFTAAGGPSAVVEPGGSVILAWTVSNAESVRLDRVSGSGPGFGLSSSVVDPVGTTWALGMFLQSAPGTTVYRLTASGPCGVATRDVAVHVSMRPNLSIGTVEVTQSIQTTAHSVPLVARKPTVVRVTVRHGLAGFGTNTVPDVRGRIRVRRSDGAVSGWIDAANNSSPMAPNPGASITVKANPQRNNTDDTLNFLIPPAWCTQSARYEIEVRVRGFGAIGTFAGFDQMVSLTTGSFGFQTRRTLEFRYIRVTWDGVTPTHAVCADTLRTAIPLLPTPSANIFALAGVGVQAPAGADTADRDDLLDDFDDRHNCSWWEALFEWLGADCPDDDGAIWVLIPGKFFRGRAFDIPSNVCFTPPGNGPYAAHEISHCLSQRHVSVNCANGQTATGGDAPGDWPNNAQLQDVPFDVTRNLALTLAGTGVFDVMTYCGTPNNTWPMPARWDRLWNEIGG